MALEIDSSYDYLPYSSSSEDDDDRSTDSIDSIVARNVYENGRRYHGFRQGMYMLPNDRAELERLDIQYHCVKSAFGGRAYTAPLETQKPLRKILDLGTGTGRWALDVSYMHPRTAVVATDLTPTQPTWIPANLVWEIDDITSPWTIAPESVDYIHISFLAGAIPSWDELLQQCYTALRPGGLVEVTDFEEYFASSDMSVPTGGLIDEWKQLMASGYAKLGRKWEDVGATSGRLLEEAGFAEVTQTTARVPVGTWPLLPQLKELGKLWKEVVVEGVEGVSMGVLARVHGWTREEVEVFCGMFRKEANGRGVHAFSRIMASVGRKPL